MSRFYCAILIIEKLLLKIMKDFLLKRPKITCVLFSIACRINLRLVKSNGNRGGRGSLALEIRVGGGGGGVKKTLPSVGGVGIFSGITRCLDRKQKIFECITMMLFCQEP